ncbi:MAG: tetratricopeptide repeat protein [Rhodobiaceae bacterium]
MFRELTPPETYAELASHDDAILVDCRSPAEWHLPAAAIWLTWNFSKTPHMKHMKRTWQTGRNSGDTNPERAFIGACAAIWLTIMGWALPAAADQTDPALDRLFTELVRTGSDAEAEQLTSEIWTRWIASDGDPDADRLMQSGMALMNRGVLDGAEQVFSQLIHERPDFAEAWNKRATVRFLLGDDTGSRRDIARVIDLEPRHFGALSGLGMINLRNGDPAAALQAFEAALQVNPHLDRAVDVARQLRKQLRGQPL